MATLCARTNQVLMDMTSSELISNLDCMFTGLSVKSTKVRRSRSTSPVTGKIILNTSFGLVLKSKFIIFLSFSHMSTAFIVWVGNLFIKISLGISIILAFPFEEFFRLYLLVLGN